jgi:predicted nucleic acid-binding Zn ribbon protein
MEKTEKIKDIPKCTICGKPFKKRHRCQKTCSPSCSAELRRRGKRKTEGPPMDKRIYTCVECGKEFHPKAQNQMTCSKTCRSARKSRVAKKRVAADRKAPRPARTKNCVICGRKFPMGSNNKNTCGPDCAAELKRRLTARRPVTSPDRTYATIKDTPGCRGPFDVQYCPLG